MQVNLLFRFFVLVGADPLLCCVEYYLIISRINLTYCTKHKYAHLARSHRLISFLAIDGPPDNSGLLP